MLENCDQDSVHQQVALSGSMVIRFTSDATGVGRGVSMMWLDSMPITLAPTTGPRILVANAERADAVGA
jgi:hypothetical protein